MSKFKCDVCTAPCILDLGPGYVGAAPDLCVMSQSTGSDWAEVPNEG